MRFTYSFLLILIIFVIANRARAEECATEPHPLSRAVAHVNGSGEKDLWSQEQAKKLSFCLSPVFRQNYEKIESALRFAAAQWMSYGNIDFRLEDDISCDNKVRKVLFRVVPTARQAKWRARAFFPSSEAVKRKIEINRRFANSPQPELNRLMLHELGHVLGLRHEHIRDEAGGECREKMEFQTITDYDPLSIMHYARCGKEGRKNYVLSELDKQGIAILYPVSL
jgi:hypothetical protein